MCGFAESFVLRTKKHMTSLLACFLSLVQSIYSFDHSLSVLSIIEYSVMQYVFFSFISAIE